MVRLKSRSTGLESRSFGELADLSPVFLRVFKENIILQSITYLNRLPSASGIASSRGDFPQAFILSFNPHKTENADKCLAADSENGKAHC